jgi:hypothetical protein
MRNAIPNAKKGSFHVGLSLILLLLILEQSVLAIGFGAAGFLDLIPYANGVAKPMVTRKFQVEVRETAYLVRVYPSAADRGIDFQEIAWNGTNGFHFTQHALRSPSNPKVLNDSTLIVTPYPEPVDVPWVGPIWIAYCANHLFSNGHPAYLRHFTATMDPTLNKYLKTLRFRAQGEPDRDPPHLLRTFTHYWDAEIEDESLALTLPREYMSGQTNKALTIISWTNANGLHVPQQFTLTQFSVPSRNQASQQSIKMNYRVSITNLISDSNRTNFTPGLGKATRVLDYRFGTPGQPFEYYATNRIILQSEKAVTEEARKQREAGQEKIRRKMETEQRIKK